MTHWNQEERRRDNMVEINLFKKVLGAISGTLIIQLIGAIWWASSMTTTLSYVRSELSDLKANFSAATDQRYRSTDASKDFAAVNDRLSKLQSQIDSTIQRLYQCGCSRDIR